MTLSPSLYPISQPSPLAPSEHQPAFEDIRSHIALTSIYQSFWQRFRAAHNRPSQQRRSKGQRGRNAGPYVTCLGRLVRGRDYEYLWYRARVWFKSKKEGNREIGVDKIEEWEFEYVRSKVSDDSSTPLQYWYEALPGGYVARRNLCSPSIYPYPPIVVNDKCREMTVETRNLAHRRNVRLDKEKHPERFVELYGWVFGEKR